MRALCLMFVACTYIAPCFANPIVLQCNATPGGPIIQTLTIDLENHWMRWGDAAKYAITSVTDQYITGFEKSDVGGEVWVQDRVSGDYWRATVFLGYLSVGADGKPNSAPEMISRTYGGRCVRPV